METLASSNKMQAELLSWGLPVEQANRIAFSQHEDKIRMVNDLTLDEIILTAVLSGIAYQKLVDKGEALQTMDEAIENTKQVIKNMLL